LLAAISSGTSLVGTSIQKNYLQENAADLLLSQMEADRKTISVKIQLGLAKSTDEYSLAQAHADVDEYAFSLSIPSALASLRAASGASLQAAKNMANEPVKAEAEKNIAVQQGEKAKAEAEAAVQQTAKTEAETKAAVVGAEKTKAETKAAVLETEKAKAETAAAAQQAEKARAQADKAEAELRKKEIEAKKSEI
jgi:hypothetical protein